MSELVSSKAKAISTDISELLDPDSANRIWGHVYAMCGGCTEDEVSEVYGFTVTLVTQIGANWKHRFVDPYTDEKSQFILLTILEEGRDVE